MEKAITRGLEVETDFIAKMEKISIFEKLAYGLGGFNMAMLSFVLASYMMFFYTDIFGISAAVVGTLLLVGRVWDGVNDMFVGTIADNTKTKWGKVRPFFLWFAVPTGIAFMAMFQVPALDGAAKVAYAFITYLLFDTFYTCIYIPNSAILTTATLNPTQRVSLNFFSAGGSMISNIGVPLVFWGLLVSLGGGDYKIGFPKLMVVIGLASIAILLYQFFFMRERHEPAKEETIKFTEGLKYMFKNKYLLTILASSFLISLNTFFVTTVLAFYGKLVLGDLSFPVKAFAVYSIVAIICFPIISLLSKKYSVKKLFIIAQFIGIGTAAARLVLGIDSAMIMLILIGIGGIHGAANFLPAVFLADCYEYGEWKFGKRIIGISVSVSGFLTKLAMALAGAVAGWMLAYANYTPESELTPELYNIMKLNLIYLPIIAVVLGTVVFMKFYDLDRHMPKIRNELEARKGE